MGDRVSYPITLAFISGLEVGTALLDDVAIKALESAQAQITNSVMIESDGTVKLMGFGIVPLAGHDGPTIRRFVLHQHWCTGCTWLKADDKRQTTDCFHPKWHGPFPGRSLGGSYITPDWCPYVPPGQPMNKLTESE